jgi:hypothetical protein
VATLAADHNGTTSSAHTANCSNSSSAAGPAFAKDGLCREYPQVNFFPGLGESSAPAKGVCGMQAAVGSHRAREL